jgi:hypothetical protein
MPDDAQRLARLEASLEIHLKSFGERLLDAETRIYHDEQDMERRHQELLGAVERTINGRIKKVEGDRDTLERMLRDLIAARIEVLEAKNAIVRAVVYGMCGIILAFVLNWLLADKFNGPHFPPQLAPAHSSKEIRQ